MKHLDILSYLLLLSGIVLSLITFLKNRYDPTYQLVVIFALVAFYLIWGLVYHYAKDDLTKKLFMEYVLIGGICTVVGVLVFYL